MINNFNQSSNWTLITIEDPESLPGKSIFNVIQLLVKVINFRYVIIDDITGAKTSSLIEREKTVVKLSDLLEIICEVVQFEWGDFFLFKEYPQNWIDSKELSYPEVMIQTDTTIRAIDNGYIYIYTPYSVVINIIRQNYKIESIKTDSLDNLDYPY